MPLSRQLPSKQEQFDLAISLAAEGHCSKSLEQSDGSYKFKKGQFDRGGKPYILHVLYVAQSLMYDTQLATIGVLHDLIEDTDMTFEKLKLMGFSSRVISALTILTHDKKDDYLDVYINAISGNYDAIRVKRKDLQHNSNITRLKGLTDKDIKRSIKYQTAFTILGKAKDNFENRR